MDLDKMLEAYFAYDLDDDSKSVLKLIRYAMDLKKVVDYIIMNEEHGVDAHKYGTECILCTCEEIIKKYK